MKNFLITIAIALVACAAAFGVSYVMNDEPAMHRAGREKDAMAWLRTEFRLDETQFAAIKKLHEDYGGVCAQHCTAIMAAKKREAPKEEIAALERTCVEAMTQHFQRVATMMPPQEAERYLRTVLPRVRDYGHEGTPSLRVTR